MLMVLIFFCPGAGIKVFQYLRKSALFVLNVYQNKGKVIHTFIVCLDYQTAGKKQGINRQCFRSFRNKTDIYNRHFLSLPNLVEMTF